VLFLQRAGDGQRALADARRAWTLRWHAAEPFTYDKSNPAGLTDYVSWRGRRALDGLPNLREDRLTRLLLTGTRRHEPHELTIMLTGRTARGSLVRGSFPSRRPESPARPGGDRQGSGASRGRPTRLRRVRSRCAPLSCWADGRGRAEGACAAATCRLPTERVLRPERPPSRPYRAACDWVWYRLCFSEPYRPRSDGLQHLQTCLVCTKPTGTPL